MAVAECTPCPLGSGHRTRERVYCMSTGQWTRGREKGYIVCPMVSGHGTREGVYCIVHYVVDIGSAATQIRNLFADCHLTTPMVGWYAKKGICVCSCLFRVLGELFQTVLLSSRMPATTGMPPATNAKKMVPLETAKKYSLAVWYICILPSLSHICTQCQYWQAMMPTVSRTPNSIRLIPIAFIFFIRCSFGD